MAICLRFAVLVISLLGAVPAQAQIPLILPRASQAPATTPARAWPRVRVSDPGAALVLRQALELASRLLDDTDCQRVLTEFRTRENRPLVDTLNQLELGTRDYLRSIYFWDGGQRAVCQEALAYTTVGGRVVFMCTKWVEHYWQSNRNHFVFTLMHEVLHTLGLGENPPSSPEITYRVRNQCWSALAAAR